MTLKKLLILIFTCINLHLAAMDDKTTREKEIAADVNLLYDTPSSPISTSSSSIIPSKSLLSSPVSAVTPSDSTSATSQVGLSSISSGPASIAEIKPHREVKPCAEQDFDMQYLCGRSSVRLPKAVGSLIIGKLSFNQIAPRLAPFLLKPKLLHVLKHHEGPMWSACFSPDGKYIVTASCREKVARLWNAYDGMFICALEGHEKDVKSACFSPDGKYILTGSVDRTARVWNAHDGTFIRPLEGHTGPIWSVCFSTDGKYIITGSSDATARIWNAHDGRLVRVLEVEDYNVDECRWVTSANFSPDGNSIVTVCYGAARLWNARNGKLIGTLDGHKDHVRSACFSPDGNSIVTGGYNNTACLWNVSDRRPICVLKGHTNCVRSVAFSPDGNYIVTASNDKTARLWNAHDGTFICALAGHGDIVASAQFSPDSNYIVTANGDRDRAVNAAYVWELYSDTPELTPEQFNLLGLLEKHFNVHGITMVDLAKKTGISIEKLESTLESFPYSIQLLIRKTYIA